jgi:hypothetical protein
LRALNPEEQSTVFRDPLFLVFSWVLHYSALINRCMFSMGHNYFNSYSFDCLFFFIRSKVNKPPCIVYYLIFFIAPGIKHLVLPMPAFSVIEADRHSLNAKATIFSIFQLTLFLAMIPHGLLVRADWPCNCSWSRSWTNGPCMHLCAVLKFQTS